MADTKRQSITLHKLVAGQLKELSDISGLSENTVIGKAISTEYFIQSKIREGKQILVHDPKTNTYTEVVFR